MGFITFFCLRAGMSLGVVWAFFGIYFAISIAIARMRAELGPPVHDLHFASSPEFLVNTLGTRKLGGANLTIFPTFSFSIARIEAIRFRINWKDLRWRSAGR